MKKYLIILSLAAMFSSCAISGPLFITDNPAGTKTGTASAKFLFGWPIDGGDLSIKKACADGDITKVSTVDIAVESGLFITTYKTIVTGE